MTCCLNNLHVCLVLLRNFLSFFNNETWTNKEQHNSDYGLVSHLKNLRKRLKKETIQDSKFNLFKLGRTCALVENYLRNREKTFQ